MQPTKSKSQFVTAIAHGQHFGSLTFQVFFTRFVQQAGGEGWGWGGVVRGGVGVVRGGGVGW